MAISIRDLGDISGRFDISEEEAERIAETVDTEGEFVTVWENEDWWADENHEITSIDIEVLRCVQAQNGRNGPVTASDVDDRFAVIRGQGSDVIHKLRRLMLIQETASPLPAGNKKHYKITEAAAQYLA